MQIKETLGISKESILNKEHNIWVGISLGNKYFTKKNTEGYIKWALTYTKEKVLVVVADSLHAINLEVLDSRGAEGAMTKALRLGDVKCQEIQDIIDKLSKLERNKIRLARWPDVLMNDIYKNNLAMVKDEFLNNPDFRKYVLDIVMNGRQDRAEKLIRLSEEKLNRLADYVLEEIPHFINGIQSDGDETVYTVLPYPGLTKLDNLCVGLSEKTMFPDLAGRLTSINKIGIIEAYVE